MSGNGDDATNDENGPEDENAPEDANVPEDDQVRDGEDGQVRDPEEEPARDRAGPNETVRGTADAPPAPQLVTRVLVTWLELTLVGLTGTLLGATVGGPPGFIVYLVTTLVTVGVLFYNVNELIKRWVRTTNHGT